MRMGSFLRVAPRAVCAGSRCLLQPSESQLAALMLRFIEVRRPQPSLVAGLEARPIAVGHRKPGGIAILTFDDHMLAKDALERKAETFRSASGWIVSTVALPLESAEAGIEGIGCKEKKASGGPQPAGQ